MQSGRLESISGMLMGFLWGDHHPRVGTLSTSCPYLDSCLLQEVQMVGSRGDSPEKPSQNLIPGLKFGGHLPDAARIPYLWCKQIKGLIPTWHPFPSTPEVRGLLSQSPASFWEGRGTLASLQLTNVLSQQRSFHAQACTAKSA